MARAFRRKKGRIVGQLPDGERELVIDVIERTAALLTRPQDAGDGPLRETAAGDEAQERAATGDDATFEALMRSAGFGGVDTAGPAGQASGEPEPSQDPALRRLLPDGHRDDPTVAREFRRLSGDNVRSVKLEHLHRAAAVLTASGARIELAEDDAVAVLRALTDVRLVLAERLELRTDDDVEHLEAQLAADAAGDERAHAMLTYDFLTWLQETLASALLP